MAYSEENMLMLSGIQHYMFCARQWALIHIEQLWSDNKLTAEGSMLHHNVDNPFYRQLNNGILTIRGFNIASKQLGLYGVADAIELIPQDNPSLAAITHPRYSGRWMPNIVEYKHGKPKFNEVDIVQVTAQAICLEEMFGINLHNASLFYFETRHRLQIEISQDYRELTAKLAHEMHEIFNKGTIPAAPSNLRKCRNCSLYDVCMPELNRCTSVATYLKNYLYEKTT